MTEHNTTEDARDLASTHRAEFHAGAQALERLDVLVADVLEETGLTEDELVAEILGADDGRDR
ncbi:hypothetical protein [Candidatus Poriferisodalis multihospitum]|uniref:hypothetical protein n=1 Tax=Candidatus Poriferisodalis multihospitum TaxID=2983191 RepID=UPI002B258E17|nr:hypothetical protein [Candidatus Poriferisodalis multihospitum]